jgi:hypothetical protein
VPDRVANRAIKNPENDPFGVDFTEKPNDNLKSATIEVRQERLTFQILGYQIVVFRHGLIIEPLEDTELPLTCMIHAYLPVIHGTQD